MIKYLGSKRLLVPLIGTIARTLPAQTACDLFAGTTRVGQELRRSGLSVISNDTAVYSEQLALAYIVADEAVDRARLRTLLAELNALPGKRGYVTRTFCEEARFFQPQNGERIDAIRERIEQLQLSRVERGLLLTSLMEAADRVDSTVGVQMAYLKQWASRSFNPLELREPEIVDGPAGQAFVSDANELVRTLRGIDLVYIDPPYNQHSYAGNYHIWETLVRWDAPESYGVARKREDVKERYSPYNSKRASREAFQDLVEHTPTPWLIVSFSNEAWHPANEVMELLSGCREQVRMLSMEHKRYVGAQIGIFSPKGRRVGEPTHASNTEHLFLAGPEAEPLDEACARTREMEDKRASLGAVPS